jgi:hypothetical protein
VAPLDKRAMTSIYEDTSGWLIRVHPDGTVAPDDIVSL